jgi:hypothetical protein
MAVESAVMFRRIARITCLVLSAGLLSSDAAVAQLPIKAPAPVTAGSVLPFSHGSTGQWSQIYSMKVDPLHHNILFLDSALSELFQLAPNASTPVLIASPAPSTGNSDCSDLEKSGSYWNAAVSFDQWDNLYVTDRYGSAVQFCRVPYNTSAGTWSFSNTDTWTGPTYTNSTGNVVPIPPQDLQTGDDGTMYVTTSDTQSIFKFTVNQAGTVTSVTPLATGLEDMVSNIAVDHAGNLFFIENAYDAPSAKVLGIREIANGAAAIVGDGTGHAESALPRIDQGYNGIKGISFDAQGDLYFTTENNTSYGGQVDGVFMIPNEGTPTSPNLVWNDTVMVAPVAAGFPVLVDSRGFIFIATGGNSNWAPPGTNAPTCDNTSTQTAAATCLASTIVLWKPGAASLGSAPVGGTGSISITAYSENAAGGTLTLTAKNSLAENQVVTITAGTSDALFPLNGMSFYVSGTGLSSTSFQLGTSLIASGASGSSSAKASVNQTQTVFFMFSQPSTPSSFAFSKPSGSNFLTGTNPALNTTSTNAVPVCAAGTNYPAFSPVETTTSTYSYCTYFVQLNSALAGGAEGELQMFSSGTNVIEGSNIYLSGVGQGSAVSLIPSATLESVASGLNDPRQVAADAQGNTYVADSALKAIEKYPAGTTTATSGTVFGSGLTAPTGVAVDGVGDLFIGDSGKIIEVPYVNGALNAAEQTTLPLPSSTKLGSHLNLAADGEGNVFVADQDNKQVVEIPDAQTTLLLAGDPDPVLAAGAGFTSPTAIATDSSGNVWVADGSNLWEITMPFGASNEVITKGLQAPVTGLAIDPSGSVIVAGATGLIWIPYNAATGTLNVNAPVTLTAGLGTSNSQLPFGVALDASQNVYADYGSGSTAGLSQLGIGGTINFSNYGEINPIVPFEVDAQVLNVGNTALTLSALSGDVFSGTNATDFSVVPATLNSPACGPTTNTAPGGSCYLGLVLQAPAAGAASGSVAVLSNASNAATGVNIVTSGNVIQDLRPATTAAITVTPTPSTGAIYPGSVTITVTISAAATYGTPTGSVSLSVGSANGNQPKQTLALTSAGTAKFTYSNLLGGTYTVNADYLGGGTAGTTQNTCSPSTSTCYAGSAAKATFTVTRATPTYNVGPPVTNTSCLNWTTLTTGVASANCTPNADFVTSWAGNVYVNVANPVFITAMVNSSVGTPSGTVSFNLSNGSPADPTQGVNGAIPLNGNGIATFSTENLPKGVYTLSAVYSGDVNYATQTMVLGTFYVISPSVQVTASSGTMSITPGTPAQATLTLEPLVGFSGNVSLECNSSSAPVSIASPSTTLPPYSECTFAYANTVTGTSPVGKSGPTASTIVVTISTNVPVNGATSSIARRTPWVLAVLFGFGSLGLFAGRKKFNRYLALVCLALMFSGLFMGISACTNAGYSTAPPAPVVTTPGGTYNVQIITYDPSALQQNSLSTPTFTLPVTVQ